MGIESRLGPAKHGRKTHTTGQAKARSKTQLGCSHIRVLLAAKDFQDGIFIIRVVFTRREPRTCLCKVRECINSDTRHLLHCYFVSFDQRCRRTRRQCTPHEPHIVQTVPRRLRLTK